MSRFVDTPFGTYDNESGYTVTPFPVVFIKKYVFDGFNEVPVIMKKSYLYNAEHEIEKVIPTDDIRIYYMIKKRYGRMFDGINVHIVNKKRYEIIKIVNQTFTYPFERDDDEFPKRIHISFNENDECSDFFESIYTGMVDGSVGDIINFYFL